MPAPRLQYACVAGSCAAFGSFFGKLTASEARAALFSNTRFAGFLIDGWLPFAVFAGLMLVSNALVWTFFVRALHASGGSLVATVTSASTNYCLSALFGALLFGESTSLVWWGGTSLVLVGLILIGTDTEDEKGDDGDVNKTAKKLA